jgi:geranylgeranyl pyrophosphate synthase
MLEKKAADAEAYLRIGGMLGGGSERQLDALGRYGRLLGMLIILRDDLEDMLDFDGGLELRVRDESLPLPLLYALEDRRRRGKITAVIKRGRLKGEKARRLAALVLEADGFERFKGLFEGLQEGAKSSIRNLKNREIFLDILQAILSFKEMEKRLKN